MYMVDSDSGCVGHEGPPQLLETEIYSVGAVQVDGATLVGREYILYV